MWSESAWGADSGRVRPFVGPREQGIRSEFTWGAISAASARRSQKTHGKGLDVALS